MLVWNWEKMGSSAVLLFTAAALLLVLAEQGQSAPAQEDQLLEEAMDGEYSAGREAVVEKNYKQIAEAQAHFYLPLTYLLCSKALYCIVM